MCIVLNFTTSNIHVERCCATQLCCVVPLIFDVMLFAEAVPSIPDPDNSTDNQKQEQDKHAAPLSELQQYEAPPAPEAKKRKTRQTKAQLQVGSYCCFVRPRPFSLCSALYCSVLLCV